MLPTKFLAISNDSKQCPSSQYIVSQVCVFIPGSFPSHMLQSQLLNSKRMGLLLWHCFCLCLLEAQFAAKKG